MNKLIIIGNGFDLAHGLPTSYKDFIEWEFNRLFNIDKEGYLTNDFFYFSTENSSPLDTNQILRVYYSFCNPSKGIILLDDKFSFQEIQQKLRQYDIIIKFKNDFFKKVFDEISKKKWVDIEREYFLNLIEIFNSIDKQSSIDKNSLMQALKGLNRSVEIIAQELVSYLNSDQIDIENLNSFYAWFEDLFLNDDVSLLSNKEELIILNFNYTLTIKKSLNNQRFSDKFSIKLINIHGELENNKNPIIFGYGDETDEYYQKFEKMNDNEFLKHMKSFSYLKTSNYRRLFELLEKGDFEVHVMGHSLGISDRLLFNHIFEHDNFQKVQLYYYEKPDGTNDYYEKTQELSRHFKDDAKHKMRLKVVPFNESQPLPQLK